MLLESIGPDLFPERREKCGPSWKLFQLGSSQSKFFNKRNVLAFGTESSLKRRLYHRLQICHMEWQNIVAAKCSVSTDCGELQAGRGNSSSKTGTSRTDPVNEYLKAKEIWFILKMNWNSTQKENWKRNVLLLPGRDGDAGPGHAIQKEPVTVFTYICFVHITL